MFSLQVNFYASLRKISGGKAVGFSLPEGSTVQQLLEAVLTRYPEMRDKLLDQNGELDRHAHIIINGRNSPLLEQGLETSISSEDSVSIFPIGHF